MRWFLCTIGILGVLVSGTPSWADSKLTIDHIDTSRYSEKGILRFYVDIHDSEGKTIPDQSKSGLNFYVNQEKGRKLRLMFLH